MARTSLFADTSEDAEQFLFGVLRDMGKRERARLGGRHNSNCHALMRQHLEHTRLGWPAEWLGVEWARIQHGEELALQLANALADKPPSPLSQGNWERRAMKDAPESWMLRRVKEALDALGVPWFVGGSMAACCRGHGRPARDIDIIAPGLQDEHGKYLHGALNVEFFGGEETLDGVRVYNFVHRESAWKIDVFMPALGQYEGEALERRAQFDLFGDSTEFWVENSEDVVLSRLRWIKSSGRRKLAWADAVGVLRASAFDGFRNLHRWAPRFGAADLLEDAIAEAGLQELRDALNGATN